MSEDGKKKYILKSKKRFFIILSIIILLVLTTSVAVFGYWYVKSIAKSISVTPSDTNTPSNAVTVTPIERPAPDERVNILVMGIADNMSDTIMLLSYYPKVGAIDIISIPRDTYVKRVSDYDSAYNKINSNYAQGGATHVVKVVKEYTKLDLNYYVEINYDAVENIIDAMGGLEIKVENNMNYDDASDDLHIHFKKDQIVTQGSDIIKVLRWRKNNRNAGGYNEGDIGRIKFQQSVVKQGIEKIISGNPISTLINIKKPLQEHVRTNMSADDIMYYVGLASKIKKEKITMQTIPGIGTMVGTLSFFVPYPIATQSLFNILINNQEMPQPLPSTLTINEKLYLPKGPVVRVRPRPTKRPTPLPTKRPTPIPATIAPPTTAVTTTPIVTEVTTTAP